jgi:hypothetical protein
MPDPVAVVISVPPDEPVEAAAGLLVVGAPVADGPLLAELPPLLHAATVIATTAAPAATAPIRSTLGSPVATARIRTPAPRASPRRPCESGLAVIRLLIFIVSLP